ncbi:MAG: FAD-binding oxidoreductase [Actinomycetota bacterium]
MLTGHSLWLDELDPQPQRPALNGDFDVDVVIVGAGFTGLWTAHALKQRDPSLSVMIVERHHVGFGASGRNGGWIVAEFACGLDKYASMSSHDEAFRLVRALHDTVDVIGEVTRAEGIDCGYHKGGTIRFARNAAQWKRQAEEVAHEHAAGFTDDDFRLLTADEAIRVANVDGVHGGLFFAHTAAVNPAKLAAGLASACEDAGVVIFERTTVESIGDHAVHTDRGTVRAKHVVQATEAYTRDLEGQRRRLLPVYSRMLATEPLSDEQWTDLGLHDRPTFADDRYMVIYGQRTDDGRIAFGGRGKPYLWGSGIDPDGEVEPGSHAKVEQALFELFPQLRGVELTHRWGGVLAIPRDWTPFVHHDRAAGFLAAGGYVGEGVAPANLAGRTMADLITGTDSELVGLPWVKALPRNWEPEPLRWIGVRSSYRLMAAADRIENRGKESKFGIAMANFLRGT